MVAESCSGLPSELSDVHDVQHVLNIDDKQWVLREKSRAEQSREKQSRAENSRAENSREDEYLPCPLSLQELTRI